MLFLVCCGSCDVLRVVQTADCRGSVVVCRVLLGTR